MNKKLCLILMMLFAFRAMEVTAGTFSAELSCEFFSPGFYTVPGIELEGELSGRHDFICYGELNYEAAVFHPHYLFYLPIDHETETGLEVTAAAEPESGVEIIVIAEQVIIEFENDPEEEDYYEDVEEDEDDFNTGVEVYLETGLGFDFFFDEND